MVTLDGEDVEAIYFQKGWIKLQRLKLNKKMFFHIDINVCDVSECFPFSYMNLVKLN